MIKTPEKAILVGIKTKKEKIPLEESLAELAQLARTAGAAAVKIITQNREAPDQKYYIGSGKLVELQEVCAAAGADLIIFDHELSPSQNRNLEEVLNIKVIDRSELILDIFAQHAFTREGRIQVELAQNNFLLTRLKGMGAHLSRLGGGIGTRGPGETKLETDRRHIRKRISQLKREVEKIRRQREVLRQKRQSAQLRLACLVGYTNSGKSTLLNALTNARIKSEDKLFATLDPTTKRVYLPGGETILITDTVGFIQKLPHILITAFRATLEETTGADLLIHVVDASSLYMQDQIDTVYKVLEEMNIITKPIITVFNKMDKVKDLALIEELRKKYAPAAAISALQEKGLEDLLNLLFQHRDLSSG